MSALAGKVGLGLRDSVCLKTPSLGLLPLAEGLLSCQAAEVGAILVPHAASGLWQNDGLGGLGFRV